MHDEILSIEQRGAQALFSLAQQARMHAVCPYSGYAVGAALLDETGRVILKTAPILRPYVLSGWRWQKQCLTGHVILL